MSRYLLISLFALSLQAQPPGPASHILFGTSLPAKCSPKSGDVFFLVTGTTGSLKTCVAVNTWADPGGSSSTLTPAGSGTQINLVLSCISQTIPYTSLAVAS